TRHGCSAFFFQAEDGIRDFHVTGVQTCALPILYRERDYHGTTIGTLATSGQPQRAEQYGPYPDGFVMVPHCLEYRKQWDVENYRSEERRVGKECRARGPTHHEERETVGVRTHNN